MIRKITVMFFLLLLPIFIYAGTTGKISGKVVDLQTGEPLIGANVIVVGTSLGAATDTHGEYVISFLDAGVYEVKASYLGYKTVTISNVRVNADLTTELNFKLPSTGISVGEVTIVAQRPLVNSSNTNAIRTTTNEEIQSLPVRGVDNIVALTPGVIKQTNVIYIRGGRQDEVGYYLEGADITNPMTSLALGIRHQASQVYIPQDAIEEIQVQAGGYTAEFGGANAGIVKSDLKTGGRKLNITAQYITDNWTFKSRNNRYNGVQNLGAYSYGYNEFDFSISGPILNNHIRLYGLFDNLSKADANPVWGQNGFNFGNVVDSITHQGTPISLKNVEIPGGPVPGNGSNQYSGVGTITFDYNPTIVRAYGTYTFNRSRTGGSIATIYDNNRLPIQDNYNGVFGLKLTELLGSNAYLEFNGNYTINSGKTYDPYLGDNFLAYGDSVANAKAGAVWHRSPVDNNYGRYNVPEVYNIFSTFNFNVPNQVLTVYNKFEFDNINLNLTFSDQLNKQNTLKIGGEFQQYTIRSFTGENHNTGNSTGLAPLVAGVSQDSIRSILISHGIINYGYDVFGNKYSGSTNYSTGSIAPFKPIFAGAYVQDRLEYKNLIVNAGLRFDYINTDNLTFKNPMRPGDAFNSSTLMVTHPENLVKVKPFTSVSPRLGFSFPITDRTMFHAQYGKFVQQPSLANIYTGLYELAATLSPVTGGTFNAHPVGLDVRPTRTTQYEIGFTQQIADFASFDITAYYKDIANQVVFGVQNTDASTGWRPYSVLTNGDYATTQGIEIAFNMRRTERFLVNGSISFSSARGTGDNPFSNSGEYGSPITTTVPISLQVPQYIIPLAFNHAVTGNLNIDYRFGKDDGPSILHEFGASLLLTFSSGHPYTLSTINNASVNFTSNPDQTFFSDTRDRTAIVPLNSAITPSTFNVDLSIDKNIEFMDNLSADIFIQVINVFNIKNVQDVFTTTGSASSNEFLTNPNLNGGANVAKYGPQYAQIYQALNYEYSGLYGVPRQIRLGIRLQY